MLSPAQITKYYYANGKRIAMRKAGTLYYLTEDHLGGTALITNTGGGMVKRLRYYPYGMLRTEEPSGGTIPTDKLFTGQQRETTNGIYHYKARLYNADIGRFPQADTFVPDATDARAVNRYSYVYNSPTTYTDPTGHFVPGYWGADYAPCCGPGFELWNFRLPPTQSPTGWGRTRETLGGIRFRRPVGIRRPSRRN